MTLSRRGLITGLISFVAAPAIVRAASLMPVKAVKAVKALKPLSNDEMLTALLRLQTDEVYRVTREQMTQILYGDSPAFRGLSALGDLTK